MTEISRRTVLGASAAGAAVLAVGGPADASPAQVRSLYTRRRFTRLRGRRFVLTDGTGSWTVTLTRVTDLAHARRGEQRSFALTFRRLSAGPPQGTYTLRRKGFRPTVLFVVPSDARRRTYQVVVN
ncbi:twin-arginine translocation signal domain-containing protein [Nocardioides KLBMP 9356]|uniref:Twin-arginine translocation signal domain-containing protein n=1 Tax=Nocardioides potassii TaxID=2911371 RepID=A0ABS9H630_9ACTN|nr:twin-arginine translocation signal domain-containing protein [Nocardioides potassii]MCF6376705.1 twin-arginine translocation signal domain-containing protein [Nocardioides potassii]